MRTWDDPNKECLTYSNFAVYEKRESIHAPGNFYTKEVGFYCPRCRELKGALSHGMEIKCKCGLHMQLFGNALFIWE